MKRRPRIFYSARQRALIWERWRKRYRNFIHLGNAVQNTDSYWKHISDNEVAILSACDTAIEWMAKKCCTPVSA